MFRSWIVLGLKGLGRIEKAALLNAANFDHCRRTGNRFIEPECVRLDGELALEDDAPGPEAAEAMFREAINLSKEHRARSWELRAAMSLARLLRARDRREEAAAGLEPVVAAFTQGLDTADFREATAIIASLH